MAKPHRQVIGVDIGGTGLKLGRFDSDGQLLAEHHCPTPQPPAPGAVTTAVVEAIEVLDPQRQADAVGVGLAPRTFPRDSGRVSFAGGSRMRVSPGLAIVYLARAAFESAPPNFKSRN